MKIAFVDDEEKYFAILKEQLKTKSAEEQLDTFSDVNLFLESMGKMIYDLVFLDIEMPKYNGIQLAEMIRDIHQKTMIVFLTNHTETMFQAYGLNIIGFIDKSRISDQLPFVLKKANDIFNQRKILVLKTKNNQKLQIELSNILFCEIKKRKITLYTSYNEQHQLIYTSINDVYNEIHSDQFLFISRSVFVNLKKIKSIGKDELYIFGYPKSLFISRTRRKNISEIFKRSVLI